MSDKGVRQFSPAQPRSQGGAAAPSKAIVVPSWQRARDLSCAALLAGEMCLVVTGLPGTGKTVLLDAVARTLRSTGWTILISAGRLPSEAEFATLTGSAAILIDDADRLSAAELRTLNKLRQCSVLLAGAVGLEKRCAADSRVTLKPLPLEEVATYVELWLERAGLSSDLMTEAAVAHLTDVSAGIPRVLGILLTASLKGARADGSDQIEEHHVDNAAWQYVEHTAARRLNRATAISAATPKDANPAPARPDADLEKRLAQAPFVDPPAIDRRTPLVSSGVLRLAGFGLLVGLVAIAAVLTMPHWSRWAAGTPTVSTQSPLREPAAAIADNVPASIVPPAADSPSPEVIKLLTERGQRMIELNDYSAARSLFRRAAEAGSVGAMLALGRSYDPAIVGSLAPAAGVDPAQAALWYRKAAASGSSDAEILLQQLEQGPRE